MIKSEIATRSKHGVKAYLGRREIQEHPRLHGPHDSRSKETGRKDRKSVLTDQKKEETGSARIQREKCPSLSSRHTEKTDATKRTERDDNLVESKVDGPKRNKLPAREKVEQPSHQDIEKGSAKSQVF